MSPIATPSGELIILEAGDYKATVASVGAGLVSLSFRGQDIVLPFPADELPPAYAGKVLVPWPNRVTGGTYTSPGSALNCRSTRRPPAVPCTGLGCGTNGG